MGGRAFIMHQVLVSTFKGLAPQRGKDPGSSFAIANLAFCELILWLDWCDLFLFLLAAKEYDDLLCRKITSFGASLIAYTQSLVLNRKITRYVKRQKQKEMR